MSRHNRERRKERQASNPDYRKPGSPTIRLATPSGITYRTHVSTTNRDDAAPRPVLRPARELRRQHSKTYLRCDCKTWCNGGV